MSREIGEALRRLVAERAWHVCEYCLVQEDDLFHGCEVDHPFHICYRRLS